MTDSVSITADKLRRIRKKVLAFYRKSGRRLPFRETRDPYAITVSEIMLQQTQVERVIPKYTAWLKQFPTWKALAGAARRDILAAWSGLGYNRRAIYLHEMAKRVTGDFGGSLPDDPAALRSLPGIGPYTANAIAVFAFGKRVAAVDTNVRKVLIHLLDLPHDTPIKEIERIAEQLLPRSDIRQWHYALMDYARVAMTPDVNRSIKPLSRQSKFEGSLRQIRGEIIRQLTNKKRLRIDQVAKDMNRTLADVRRAAEGLARDGLVVITNKTIRLR